MNRSEAGFSDALKIEGDGRLDETFWTIETNLVSEDDTTGRRYRESTLRSGEGFRFICTK